MKSGMYIESHLERYALVQKAELYTFGKYLNCNLEVCAIYTVWEIAIIAIENFSRSPVGA